MILGLTGGIASGKTFCSNYLFRQYQITVVDADVIARRILRVDSLGLERVVAAFGRHILQADGSLNRAALRAEVFTNEEARLKLNAITHPLIRHDITAALDKAARKPYAILSAPLLLENGLEDYCQAVLVVDVPLEVQIVRGSQRDKQSRTDLNKIIATQISRADRLAQAHYIVDNSQTPSNTCDQLEYIHEHLVRLFHSSCPVNKL